MKLIISGVEKKPVRFIWTLVFLGISNSGLVAKANAQSLANCNFMNVTQCNGAGDHQCHDRADCKVGNNTLSGDPVYINPSETRIHAINVVVTRHGRQIPQRLEFPEKLKVWDFMGQAGHDKLMDYCEKHCKSSLKMGDHFEVADKGWEISSQTLLFDKAQRHTYQKRRSIAQRIKEQAQEQRADGSPLAPVEERDTAQALVEQKAHLSSGTVATKDRPKKDEPPKTICEYSDEYLKMPRIVTICNKKQCITPVNCLEDGKEVKLVAYCPAIKKEGKDTCPTSATECGANKELDSKVQMGSLWQETSGDISPESAKGKSIESKIEEDFEGLEYDGGGSAR